MNLGIESSVMGKNIEMYEKIIKTGAKVISKKQNKLSWYQEREKQGLPSRCGLK